MMNENVRNNYYRLRDRELVYFKEVVNIRQSIESRRYYAGKWCALAAANAVLALELLTQLRADNAQ